MAEWRTYEEVAKFLIEKMKAELGLERVEGLQTIVGKATSWEIDAKGVREGGEGFVIIEVRRRSTRRLNQEGVAAIAYRISDTGALGGIVVSPLGLQEGAKRVAAAAGIVAMQLDAKSTAEQFVLRFLNKVMVGLRGEALTMSAGVVSVEITNVSPVREE